jgi:hypothetical protein
MVDNNCKNTKRKREEKKIAVLPQNSVYRKTVVPRFGIGVSELI